MIDKNLSTSTYRHKIIKLGISRDLLKCSAIQEEHYKKLYKRLKRIEPDIKRIKYSWQLALFVHSSRPFDDILKAPHCTPYRFIRCAALAANVSALKWIDEVHPDWFYAHPDDGFDCIRYAFKSGNPSSLEYFYTYHREVFDEAAHPLAYLIKDIDTLNWVLKNCPKVIKKNKNNVFILLKNAVIAGDTRILSKILQFKSYYLRHQGKGKDAGKTLADIAAMHGKINVLNWLLNHYDDLLYPNAYNGSATIAHYAALAGNIKSLNWILDHYPALLTIRIHKTFRNFFIDEMSRDIESPFFLSEGNHIGFYAAKSNKPEAIEWVNKHCRKYMYIKNDAGFSPLDYVIGALSTNSVMIEKFLALTGNRSSIKLKPTHSKLDAFYLLPALDKFLKNNYNVVSIINIPSYPLAKHKESILRKLERNKKLEAAIHQSIERGKCLYSPDQPLSNEQQFLMYQYFKKQLPADIPHKIILDKFGLILNSLQQKTRLAFQKKNMLNILDKQTGLLNKHDKNRINAYCKLQLQIKNDAHSVRDLKNIVLSFYKNNRNKIIYQKKPQHVMSDFFKKTANPVLLFESQHHALDIRQTEAVAESMPIAV